MNKIFTAFIMCFLAGWCASNIQATILYVKPGAASTAWQSQATVYTDLGSAITAAVSGDEIWVAAGTYKPTTTTNRLTSFNLKDGVAIYGGFLGTETSLGQRSWYLNKTILSGDIGVAGTATDNSYNVVSAIGTSTAPLGSKTALDGVIIEDGYGGNGAGLTINYANPLLSNLLFRNNYTSGRGGGFFAMNCSSFLVNSLFFNNTAGQYGGAVCSESAITLVNCTFAKNKAWDDGAVCGYNIMLKAYNCISWNNIATNSTPEFSNVNATNSCVTGIEATNGNINTDPLFIDLNNGDLRINTASPCIDKGLNSLVPTNIITDYAGNSRVIGSTVDMGAWEGGVVTPILSTPLSKEFLSATTTQVSLNWGWASTTPSGITGYEIEVSKNGGVAQYFSSATTSYILTGLNPADVYQWRVRGVNGSTAKNWSPYSTFFVSRGFPLHVKVGGTGTGDSWSSALGNLKAAMDNAVYGDTIWVAAGTYKPTTTNDRTISFNLKDGVVVYGGFAGTETDLKQRNWVVNKTILSGDIGVADSKTDNSYSVVSCLGTLISPLGNTTRLDGVIVEKGNGGEHGGGLNLAYSSPVVCNVLFRNNNSNYHGGACFALYCDALFENCIFANNQTVNYGGAVYLGWGSKNTFLNCHFVNNTSNGYGAAIYGGSNTKLINSIIYGNTAKYSESNLGDISTCTNCCIEGSYAGTGNISANPLFIDVLNGDFRLNAISPCIDKGLNSAIPAGLTTDFGGNPRLVGSVVDMGAYEGSVVTPIATKPLESAVLSATTTQVSLEWEWKSTAPAAVTSYEIEIIRNGGIPQYYTSTTTNYTLIGLAPTDIYQWRVRGVDGGTMKNWSPISTFLISRGHPLYVKEGGTGTGSSWTSALGDLKAAMDQALMSDTIWVAAGTYKPTATTDRTISFVLKDGVVVYGGFAGTETMLSQRNWSKNKTILSGDIGVVGTATDNSKNIVKCTGALSAPVSQKARLDGLIIEQGYADGDQYSGGGLFLKNANPKMSNLFFRKNYASSIGGAVYAINSSTNFANCLFVTNQAINYGGAAFNESLISFTNCNFIGNTADNGGALYASYNTRTLIANCVAWGNSSTYGNDFVSVDAVTSWLSTTYSSGDNIYGNPMFVDAANGDYRLNAVSPCIDKGSNSSVPVDLTTDFGGNPRLAGAVVDMGAFEGAVVTPIATKPLEKAILPASATQISLEWEWKTTAPSGITSYEIEVIRNGGAPQYYTSASMSYNLTGLAATDVYQWRVRGVDGGIDKNWSPVSTFVIARGYPLHVKVGGTGTGVSWSSALGDLKVAMDQAVYGDTIWVASGIYKPTTTTDRKISFILKDGVAVYGGFAGAETALAQRSWSKNKTILNGDIGVEGTNTDNTLAVVQCRGNAISSISQFARLDGLIIELGYANGSSANGAGLYLSYANPKISNTLFRNNYANGSGGAVFANYSTTNFSNCLFINNKSNNYGGAVYTDSKLSFTHCNFFNNASSYGGDALWNNTGTVPVTNSIFWNNNAGNNSEFVNLSISNSCYAGAGSGNGNNISGDPLFVDAANGDFRLSAASPCIDKGLNTATPADLIYDFAGNPRLVRTAVDMGAYEGGVITPLPTKPIAKQMLPAFTSEVLLEWAWNTTIPAKVTGYEVEVIINGGTPLYFNSATTSYNLTGLHNTDAFKWRVRGIDGSNTKDWSVYSTFTVLRGHPLYVKEGGTGTGTSWASAAGNLKTTMDNAVYGDTIWVAAGTYKPTTTSDRSVSFNLKDGVDVFGGFAGSETIFGNRNISKNKTILSGDIGAVGVSTDNSVNIVKCRGSLTDTISKLTRLDGVTIEAGYANTGNSDGGALNLYYANPDMVNVTFSKNYAGDDGGAVYATASLSCFFNCHFADNKSGDDGGAIFSQSSLSFINCLFTGNRSEYYSGAIYGSGNCLVVNSIGWGNSAAKNTNQFSGCNIYSSCIEGGNKSNGNINVNPIFVDAANGNYRLLKGSPCINTGSNERVPDFISTDVDGLPRIIESKIDMGIYEAAYLSQMTPAMNGVFKQNPYMGGDLSWNFKQALTNDQIKAMNFTVTLWNKETPQTLIVDRAVGSANTTSIQPLPFSSVFKWLVGVKAGNYTYMSDTVTFYVGRENPIYVKPNGTGDGSTWDLALGSVSDALEIANPGDRIWVAAGTYKPEGNGKDAAFKLKPFVELLGGYKAGDNWGTSWSPAENVTILSGDIGAEGDATDNVYHVFNNNYTADAPLIGAVIDGFTITGGNAATVNGGGMLNVYANPKIRNCKFAGNSATSGGAIYNEASSPTILNSLLNNNTATSKGSAIYSDANSAPVIINCTVAGNTAASGGAVVGAGTVGNTIVYSNTGGQVSGTASYTYSCIEGGLTGEGNISDSPRFVDAAKGNYQIGPFTSCFEMGNNDLVPADIKFSDLSFSEQRIFVNKVDIGAYELSFPEIAARIEIVQSNPDSAAVGVDYKTPIELTFNEPITILDPAGIHLKSGESFQSMTLSADKKTLTLTPANDWPFESAQELLFDNGAIRFAINNNFRMVEDTIPFTIRACQPAAMTVSTSSNAACAGTEVTLTAEVTGDALDNYSWTFGGAAPFALKATSFTIESLGTDSVGVYTCNVSDMCGLSTSAQATVSLKEGVLTPVIHKKWNDIYLVDNSSTRFTDYKWYADKNKLDSEEQYVKVMQSNVKLYVVAYDETSGCWSTSDTTITSAGSSKVSVYPNPVVRSQSLKISLGQESANVKVKLFDINGRLVSMNAYANIDEVTYDDTNLDTGVYTMEISTDEAITQVKLVIK